MKKRKKLEKQIVRLSKDVAELVLNPNSKKSGKIKGHVFMGIYLPDFYKKQLK